MKNKFLIEIKSRGYLNQCTDLDGLEDICNKKSIIGYIGFDCTAQSLHVGSLLQIMILRTMQRHGHKPIVLLGGGTTLIGDPSGKDETRKVLDPKQINKNIKSIKKVFTQLLDSKNKNTKPVFVDNSNWLTKLNYIKFLREIGRYFTINKMLAFDSVKLRLEREQSLSYMEFNYMILQAYDFYQLFKKNNCILQIGGSDQWGNIVSGVDLIRRLTQKTSYGLTTPLITLASGAKMGKTEKGAIWLNKDLLSPYDYWQFWRNTDDRDVEKFLNYLKILLANEATKILHGKEASKIAEQTARETFKEKGLSQGLPEIKLDKKDINSGIKLLDFLVKNKIMSSKSEGRRIINNKGLKIDDIVVQDENKIFNQLDFKKNFVKLSLGKKKHFLIKVV